nr:Ankyrin and K Homology domain containing protein [Haemonchus contortus]
MAEDETVPVASVDDELAERLGVPLLESHEAVSNEKGVTRARLGKRSQSSSPTTNSRSTASTATAVSPSPFFTANSPCVPKSKRVKVKANYSRSAATMNSGRVIPELTSFVHLLPDMTRVDPKGQMELYQILYENSVRLYTCLQNYLSLCVFGTPPPIESLTQAEMVARISATDTERPLHIENSTMRDRMDQAFEALCDEMQLPEISVLPELVGRSPEAIDEYLKEHGGQVSVDMLVNALNLYAAAGLRKPPTRAVEGLMAAAQDGPPQTDIDHRGDPTVDEDARNGANLDGLILLASSAGLVDLLAMLVRIRGSTNFATEQDCTPLMEACAAGNVRSVKCLLDLGADINAYSITQNTPLIYAAAAGQEKVVRMLIDSKCNLDLRNENGHCALMEAASAGHLNIVKLLIESGAKAVFVNMNSEFKESPLTLAAYKGYTDVIEYLLSLNDYDRSTRDEELHTALMEAAMDGHLEVARILIQAGAPVNLTSESYESPLTLSCCGGHAELAKLLIDAGANIEETNDENYTPLMEAAREGHVHVVKILLENGAQVNATTDETMETALTGLYSNGADLNFDYDGRTALMKAAKNGFVEIVEFLVSKGADVNYRSSNGDATALSLACSAGHKDIVKLLLKCGADPNIELKDGVTCVMEAARNGFVNIVEMMLDHSGVFPQPPRVLPSGTVPQPEKGSPPVPPPPPPTPTTSAKQTVTAMRRGKKSSSGATAAAAVAPPLNTASGGSVPSPKTSCNVPNPDSTYGLSGFPGSQAFPNASGGGCSMQMSSTPTSSMSAAEMKARVEAFEMLTKTSPFLMQYPPNMPLVNPFDPQAPLPGSYPPNMPLVNPFDPQAPLPGSVVNTNPLTLADVSMPSFQEMLKGPEAKQNAQQWSEYMRKRFAAQSGMCENLQQRFDAIANGDNLSIPRAASLPAQSTSAPSTPGMTEKSTVPVGRTVSNQILRRALPSVAQSAGLNASASQVPIPPAPPATPGLVPAPDMAPSVLPTAAAPPTPGFASLRRAHSEGDDLDITRATASQRAAFNVDKATESNNDTPLTLACSNGHAQMVDVLVCRGANIEHRDKKGFTPLILAATGGHRDVVELLLNNGAQIEAQSERTKDTALSLACSGGRKDVVELLLSRGANKEHRNVSDYTPLSLAASGGYVEIVNMLLNAGAEINSRTGSKLGISPLMLAAMNGHKEATRVLLEQGSDINAQIETNRNTALTLACFQGRTEVVGLLLQYNANVEHRAKTGLTPLMEAANGGYVEVGELLLDACADPNTAPVPSSRDTALTIAADKGHERFVDMLVHRGAHIDARNKKGCTALWLACHGGHLETVQTLVKHGADVDMQDNRKMSPLMVAFRKGHVKVVQHMVQHVRQFPGDQELFRYLTTISEPDLLRNCQECMDLIVKAKNAQAEEANRAAESLLALLAEEEEAARSKKQAKLRKKEKKKEKKAKKHDGNDKERSTAPLSDAPAPASNAEESPTIPRVKEESEEYSDDESDSLAVKKERSSVPVDPMTNDRVPKMRTVEEPSVVASTPERPNPSLNRQQKRSANRRSRNESGKSANGQLPNQTNSSAASKVVPSPVFISKPTPPTDEWVKASKKTKPSNKPKTASSNVTCSVGKDFYMDDSYSGWKDVELSRRRSTTLSVCSTVIARVIGRGGANINAIREATGASIEVEKQSAVRRDQHDRQICIRGTQETVRNATLMINGLITDNEISVNDVIRQVLRGNASSTTSSDGSRLSNPHDNKMTAMATTTVSSASSSTSKPSTMAPVTTNVWQQRMAARQREQQQQLAMSSSNASKENSAPHNSADNFSATSVTATSTPSLLRRPAAPFASRSESQPASTVPAPIGPPSSSASLDKELPRKAPGYRSPSTQTSSSSSAPVEQTVISSVASSVSSTPPPAPIGSDSSTRCVMNSPPIPIAPPPGFSSLASEVSKTASVKATVSPLSTPSVEPPGVDVVISSLNDIATSTVAPVGKLSSADSLTTPTGTGNDLSAMQFLDETTRAKLAEIWGTGKQDQTSQEQAWGNQVLLNNFANLNIRSSSTDWASAPHDNLFMSSPSSKVASVSSNQQNISAHQSGTTFVTSPSSNDWPVSSAKSMPLYARPQARIPTVPPHPIGNTSSTTSTMPRQYNSSSNQPENNMLFNQLAAQLLIQQQGVASTPVPPAQSYYPSPSYTDPAIIGMGHLSTPTTGSAGNATSSIAPKSAYNNPYQAASNEYESLNSLLSSSFAHHQNGDFNISHASSTYPSSPSAARSLNASRIQSGAGAFAPPPGFASVVSSQSTGIGGANPTVPPPSLRPYYNTQMPPPAGLPLQPSQHASFTTYSSQHNNWMSSGHGKQTGGLQQQLPWWN